MSVTTTAVQMAACPSVPDAEQLLLGVLIREPKILERPEIHAGLFDLGKFRQCFTAIRSLFAAGTPVDIISVAQAWREAGIPDASLLAVDLHDAADAYVWQGIVPVLRETAERRRWWQQAHALLELADAPALDRSAVAEISEALADDVATHAPHQPRALAVEAARYLETAHERQNKGVGTGWPVLDSVLGGFRAGELTILAARTSVGKSSLALQLASHLATHGQRVLYVSPEMSEQQLIERSFSAATGLRTDIVRDGEWDRRTRAELDAAVLRLPIGLAIWDAVDITSADVAIMARQTHGRTGLDFLVVDHLGYLGDQPLKYENRTLILGRMMKAIKALTRKLGIHALVLHQLNRQSEDAGTMRRPSLSDLRDSGSIEEDADNVLLLHRATRLDADAEIIVAKNRQGPLGDVPLRFFAETTTFAPRWRSEMGGS